MVAMYYGEDDIITLGEADLRKWDRDELTQIVRVNNRDDADFLGDVLLEKAERVRACGGDVYLLTINYFVSQSCEWKIIKEAVWKGSSVVVLYITKKTESDIHSDDSVSTILAEDDYKFYAKQALDDVNAHVGGEEAERKMFPPMELVKVISVKDSAHEGDHSECEYGHIFTREHTMIFEAKPFYKHHGSTPVIFETLLLNREWLQLMDKQISETFFAWREAVLKNQGKPPPPPPRRRHPAHNRMRHLLGLYGRAASKPPRASLSTISPKSLLHFAPVDLCSPKIITHALFAMHHHNNKRQLRMEFDRVLEGKRWTTAGHIYELTILVTLRGLPTAFKTNVWDKFCTFSVGPIINKELTKKKKYEGSNSSFAPEGSMPNHSQKGKRSKVQLCVKSSSWAGRLRSCKT